MAATGVAVAGSVYSVGRAIHGVGRAIHGVGSGLHAVARAVDGAANTSAVSGGITAIADVAQRGHVFQFGFIQG
jgi:hypothetical protein